MAAEWIDFAWKGLWSVLLFIQRYEPLAMDPFLDIPSYNPSSFYLTTGPFYLIHKWRSSGQFGVPTESLLADASLPVFLWVKPNIVEAELIKAQISVGMA